MGNSAFAISKDRLPSEAKSKKAWVSFFSFWDLDYLGFLQAKLIQFLTEVFGSKKIDVAFISEIRHFNSGDEKKDGRLFGFNYRKFRVLPWIKYSLKSDQGMIHGQLFMIGIRSFEITKNRHEAQKLFLEAVDMAVSRGAKVILLAANTKSIFGRGEEAMKRLEKLCPSVIFTLGDNLTAGFIDQRIASFFGNTGLRPEEANVLVAAPRGLLGESSVSFLKRSLGCKNIWGMFDSTSCGWEEAEKRGKENGFTPVFSYLAVTAPIDLAVICGAQDCYRLKPEMIRRIARPGKKLIIIDPCEPSGFSRETLEESRNDIIYRKAGNGFNRKLKYILGKWAAGVLGMKVNIFWGCFSETFVLAYALKSGESIEEIKKDLFVVKDEKIRKAREWAAKAGFSLPKI
jgi:hypothetical protein